jgi:alkanesulfonate monooxygenase SsuD/methylene tetrahydromethanopterin reductase-like flavin-dependent oxidoreductase (luciferase family)
MRSASDYYADAFALCEQAEATGLQYVKMTEHYLHAYGGFCPSPLTFLAAVAARTLRIRLMTGCVIPVFHHPVQLAAHAAMVDVISRGRLDVGFARAYLPYEFDTFGVSLDGSRERYEESIDAILRLWTEESVTIESLRIRNARNLPPPVQRPHPPVWVAAVRSRQSFAWIGEKGFNLLVTLGLGNIEALRDLIGIYREAFRESHGPAVGRVFISIPLYLAKTEREAVAEGERYLRRSLDVWADACESLRNVQSADYPGYTKVFYAIRNASPEQMRKSGNALIGTPEHVAERVAAIEATLGVDGMLWNLDYGGLPGATANRILTLFVKETLPRLSLLHRGITAAPS